jgi:hypothetical protein
MPINSISSMESRQIMNITLLDADTREVIYIVDGPNSPEYMAGVREFVTKLGAEIARTIPHETPDEWTVELRIPVEVRRVYTPLPGDRVLFTAKAGIHEHEVSGVYQFKRRHSYIILDDSGQEWEVQSMWQMKKS